MLKKEEGGYDYDDTFVCVTVGNPTYYGATKNTRNLNSLINNDVSLTH